jgi:predicted Fe-S protein YdhL (DUF1289 family)
MLGTFFIAMTLGFPTSQKSGPAIAEVLSPCIGVCTLAPNGLCIGCLRTSEEIGLWLNYTAGDRARIMNELPQRLESLFAL